MFFYLSSDGTRSYLKQGYQNIIENDSLQSGKALQCCLKSPHNIHKGKMDIEGEKREEEERPERGFLIEKRGKHSLSCRTDPQNQCGNSSLAEEKR